jgi:hypothetical protein
MCDNFVRLATRDRRTYLQSKEYSVCVEVFDLADSAGNDHHRLVKVDNLSHEGDLYLAHGLTLAVQVAENGYCCRARRVLCPAL